MSELKPCPFCGSTEVYTIYSHPVLDYFTHYAWVNCPNCGSGGHVEKRYKDGEETKLRLLAATNWNARPIEDALNARIAELEAAQRWIPVSERLPEDGVAVLVAFTEYPKDIDILTAKYYKHYAGFGGIDNWWNIEGWHTGNVTHWMPLPTPPEVQK